MPWLATDVARTDVRGGALTGKVAVYVVVNEVDSPQVQVLLLEASTENLPSEINGIPTARSEG